MSDTIRQGYDTSIGTHERSARSATKVFGILLGIVFLIGLIFLGVLYNSNSTGTVPNGTVPAGGSDSSSHSPGP